MVTVEVEVLRTKNFVHHSQKTKAVTGRYDCPEPMGRKCVINYTEYTHTHTHTHTYVYMYIYIYTYRFRTFLSTSKTSPPPFSIEWKHDIHCTCVFFLSQLQLNHKHVYIFLSYPVRLSSHLHWLYLQAEIPPFDSRQVATFCCPSPLRDMTASGAHTVFNIEGI
jgi:hypothetical protein